MLDIINDQYDQDVVCPDKKLNLNGRIDTVIENYTGSGFNSIYAFVV